MTEGLVRPRLLLLALLLTGLLGGCSESGTLGFDDYRVVDLTHTFDESTLYWPTDQPFQHERTAWGRTEGGYWYSSFTYGGSEHGGTHLDAPIHFAEGKRAAAEIPVDELIGPAVVIDITAQCDADPDYRLSVAVGCAQVTSDKLTSPPQVLFGQRTVQAKLLPDPNEVLISCDKLSISPTYQQLRGIVAWNHVQHHEYKD